MRVVQKKYTLTEGWQHIGTTENTNDSQLVLAFGSPALLERDDVYSQLKDLYPKADILISSTAGEILDTEVNDNSIVVTAISFEKAKFKSASIHIEETSDSYEAGCKLSQKFDTDGLVNVFVISDGQLVNGSELVTGMQQHLPANVILTGGLAGDGTKFKKTLVGLNQAPRSGCIAAIGFYGGLKITYGSVGGWDPFGPERLITRSKANVLYELDGKPALDIYKLYLGDYAQELPGSGLLFPLSIRTTDNSNSVVRTILNINEEEKSLTFAGNMPEGAYARLMKANMDRLIEGASNAAQNSVEQHAYSPELALLVSCVGRKLVLDQRIEEEVEVIRAIYGNKTFITGFYSYGEISPSFNFMKCELHNQTMTITTMTEI